MAVDNSSTIQQTESAGIKISQPGYSAANASSTNLIFDSNWPSLAVVFKKKLTMPTTYTLQTVNHGLGFPAFARLWVLDSNSNPTQNLPLLYSNWSIDSQNIYFTLSNYTIGSYIYIECFNIDLSKDVDYPILPNVTSKTAYDPNYGIKIAKPNLSTSSKDLRDYVVHSRARSPLVKAVKTQQSINSSNVTSTASTIQYTNQDGVATWNYGFVLVGKRTGLYQLPSGSYQYAPYYAQSYPITHTNGITTSVSWTTTSYISDTGATIVVLRDPLFATNYIEATY